MPEPSVKTGPPGEAYPHGFLAPCDEWAAFGRLQKIRRRPWDGDEALAPGAGMGRYAAHQAPGVGMQLVFKELPDRGFLHDLPSVHYYYARARLGHDGKVMSYQDDRGAGFFAEIRHHLEDLRLDRNVKRGRRLIRYEQGRLTDKRHRNHGALAHPAAELVRVSAEARWRVRYAYQVQHLYRLCPGLSRAALFSVNRERLDYLLPDREYRVERSHGILKNHRDLVTTERPHLARALAEEVFPVEGHFSRDDFPGIRKQPQNRQGRHALPASGLADDADGLPGRDVKIHAPYGLHLSDMRKERDAEIPHLKQGRGGGSSGAHFRSLGSRASLKPSPTKLKPSMVAQMNTAGKKS